MKHKSLVFGRFAPVFAVATVAWALVWSCAAADQVNRYKGDIWAFEDAKKVMADASDITLAKYPDCDEATVERKSVRVYRADGTGEAQDENFTLVLTEKGKRNNRTISESYMLPYSTVDVVKLEVIRRDGEVIPVDVAANSKDSIDDSQMSMNIYDPNSRVLRVNIPRLEIGDVVHSIVRQTTERPIIPGEYAEENVFEGSGYIRHITYDVHAPKERPLKRIALRAEIPGTVKYTKETSPEGGLVHHWEVNNVPRMFDEPAMPPYEMVLQRLYVSTTPDWKAVSKWYWELSDPHLQATTPELKQRVADLTKNAKDDLEKVHALFYNVSHKVRYMGLTPEKDRPGFEPHDVKITFDKQYGVCRDKAALLVSMLRTAGLKAYPVLISVGVKRDAEVPDPDFNHAIVCVELKKGEYTLMDPTDDNTRDLLPSYDSDQSYLVCRPEGEDIKLSPVGPPEEHMMRVKTTGTLTAAGALEGKSEMSFEGVNDDAYRQMFAHMKPDDERRFFERTLKTSMPGARLKSLKLYPDDMTDMSSGVRAEIEFSVEGLTATGNGKSVVSLPWIGKHMGVVNFILSGAGLDKRKYPMRTDVACGLEEDISIKLADGFTGALSMPTCPQIDDKSVSCKENFAYKDGTLDCSRALKLKTVEFSPAEYVQLKDTLKSMEYDERKAPVMAVSEQALAKATKLDDGADPPVDSNAKILESHKELDITDPHTSVYRVRFAKQILTYAGKTREAEVKIDFNPSCQEAKLVRGVVTSRTGQRQEISPDEINVMDAGWNASARRYTGGKVLVANLPGVDVGSTIEVGFEITSKNRPFIAGFESFQLPDAMDHKTFQLTAPPNVKIQQMVNGDPGAIKQESKVDDSQQKMVWQADHVKALPAENQLPPEWAYGAGVSFFAGDMKTYLTDLNDTLVAQSHKATKAEQLARELTAKTSDKLEKVKAIRDFVAKSIRLAGPSFAELPLSELSPADTTLADGYGHSADRAILLHAMLNAAGFQPEFVLASGLPPIDGITNVAESFPLPNTFQLPLVRLNVDGQTYYLNDTDQYAKLGSTASDDRIGLALSSQSYEVIKAAKDCRDKTETVYTLSASDNGKTRVGVERRFYGTHYNGQNRYFSELPPEERRRYFQEVVSGMAQGARPVSDLVTRFDTYPGVEQYAVEVDNYSVVDGKYFYFDLPFTPSLFPVGADHRTLPLFLAHRGDSAVRTEIELPSGFRHVVIAPKSETLDAPDGSGKARITATEKDGKCVITHDFESTPAIVQPKDYQAMLNVESTLRNKSSKLFLLEKD